MILSKNSSSLSPSLLPCILSLCLSVTVDLIGIQLEIVSLVLLGLYFITGAFRAKHSKNKSIYASVY